MYIENYDFKEWMQKLFDKLDELCKDVRVLRNVDKVLSEDDNLLDNQDLCLLFKVSIRTLQRLRSKNKLPYMLISGKVYYRCAAVLHNQRKSLLQGFRCPGVYQGTV